MEVVARKISSVTPVRESVISDAVSSVLQRLFSRRTSKSEKSYTLSEVGMHCHWNDCWIVIGDSVYDITSFLSQHPGGLEVLLENAGLDATVAFYGAGHSSKRITEMLEKLRIGSLAQHERVNILGCRGVWLSDGLKVAVAD